MEKSNSPIEIMTIYRDLVKINKEKTLSQDGYSNFESKWNEIGAKLNDLAIQEKNECKKWNEALQECMSQTVLTRYRPINPYDDEQYAAVFFGDKEIYLNDFECISEFVHKMPSDNKIKEMLRSALFFKKNDPEMREEYLEQISLNNSIIDKNKKRLFVSTLSLEEKEHYLTLIKESKEKYPSWRFIKKAICSATEKKIEWEINILNEELSRLNAHITQIEKTNKELIDSQDIEASVEKLFPEERVKFQKLVDVCVVANTLFENRKQLRDQQDKLLSSQSFEEYHIVLRLTEKENELTEYLRNGQYVPSMDDYKMLKEVATSTASPKEEVTVAKTIVNILKKRFSPNENIIREM